MVAEQSDLDLAGVDRPLDQQLAVVARRLAQGGNQLPPLLHLADAHRRAEVRGLDEDREPERGQGALGRRLGVRAQLFAPDQHPRHDGDPRGCQQTLGRLLVHLERGAEHAGADVRHARELEQALERAVLAALPVDDREDHVDRLERARGVVARARHRDESAVRPGRRAGVTSAPLTAASGGSAREPRCQRPWWSIATRLTS